MPRSILFINGSLRGSDGNTGGLFAKAEQALPEGVSADHLVLATYRGSVEGLAGRLEAADAFLFGTGVYWGSWGSPLQRFLEVLTAYELTPCFLGKPVGAAVTADSIGGLEAAQRLLGALSLFGCIVPPLSTLVLSRVTANVGGSETAEDVFQVNDVCVVLANLLAACELRPRWQTWPIRSLEVIRGDYPASGLLSVGLEKFL